VAFEFYLISVEYEARRVLFAVTVEDRNHTAVLLGEAASNNGILIEFWTQFQLTLEAVTRVCANRLQAERVVEAHA
jgi:hypothetical protein